MSRKWFQGKNGLVFAIGYWWYSRRCQSCGTTRYRWKQLRIMLFRPGEPWVRSYPFYAQRESSGWQELNERPTLSCRCVKKWPGYDLLLSRPLTTPL